MSVLSITLPLFAIIALGIVAVRTGYLSEGDIRSAGRVTIRIAVPALIVSAISGASLGQSISPSFVAAYGLASLAIFAAGLAVGLLWLRTDLSAATMLALGASTSNSGFIGYPVATLVIGGDNAALLLAQCMIVENLVTIPLAIALAEAGSARGDGWRSIARLVVRGLVRNPIVLAILFGLAFAATGLSLPGFADETIGLLASAAAPIALFVVGGSVATARLGGNAKLPAASVFLKLVVHPVAVGGALMLAPANDTMLTTGALIFAASPMLSIFPIIGQRYRLEEACSTALVFALVFSFLSLNAVLYLLGA